MKFYYQDGNRIASVEKFIDLYSKDYYLKKPGERVLVHRLRRSSEYIEDEITRILDNGIKNNDEGKREVAMIIAWKTGKIDHVKSQEKKNFVYTNDWQNAEQLEGVNIMGKYPIKDAVEYIVREKDELAKKDPPDFLNELKDKSIFNGIGTVYMTTLLYFLTHGTYPIYDRFAHQAAKAIYLGINPNDVYIGFAPDKSKTNEFLKMYNEYCWLLSQIFGAYKISREQDQALWVYGHVCINSFKSDDDAQKYKMFDY